MNIGQKLKNIREERDLTLDAIAKTTGVAKATLSRIENGIVGGNINTLKKITDVLHISLDDLVAEDATKVKASEENSRLLIETVKKDLKEVVEKLTQICKKLNIELNLPK